MEKLFLKIKLSIYLTKNGGFVKYDCLAGIAQLVEHNLAKVGVASSNLVSRSIFKPRILWGFFSYVRNGQNFHFSKTT